MEYALRELYCPVWDSLTGAHPGLFTSENKKALESYWYRPDNDASKKKERKNIYWIENKLLTFSYIKNNKIINNNININNNDNS